MFSLRTIEILYLKFNCDVMQKWVRIFNFFCSFVEHLEPIDRLSHPDSDMGDIGSW